MLLYRAAATFIPAIIGGVGGAAFYMKEKMTAEGINRMNDF